MNSAILIFLIAILTIQSDSFGQPCSETTGSAAAGTIAYELNPLKNRTTAPNPSHINNLITIDNILTEGNDDNRFSNSDGAVIEGYVVLVKLAGKESCNCNKAATMYRDIHLEIAKTKDERDKSKLMVVEITPKIRATKGSAWSIPNLKKLKGHKIQITGWMFFDRIHKNAARNTSPDAHTIHRATAWEIHPVTNFEKIN